MSMKERRSEQEAHEARERILDAAARAFASGGLGTLRMEDIAAEAGYSVASLYNYFRNKDEMLSALIDRTLHEFVGAAGMQVPSTVPPEAELEWLALRLLTVARANLGLMAFVLSPRIALGTAFKQELTERYMRIHGQFVEAIERRVDRLPGVSALYVPMLAFQFVGILRTETFRWLFEPPDAPERDLAPVAAQLTRFFLAGARALTEEP